MDISNTYKGRLCVITGAASGIGRALAVQLGRAGASLALSDVNEAGLTETAKLAGAENSNQILTTILDVANESDVADYAGHVQAELGDANYVFNVAGLTRVGQFDEAPLSSMETIMDVNFWGVVRMSKAFLPQLKNTKGGLINISSIFGIIGYSGQTAYCASKFAVRGFSETLAQELKPLGVSVSCVHPGGVETNIVRNAKIDVMPDNVANKEEMEARFKKVAITSSQKAALIILDGAAKSKRRILVGKDAKITALVNRLFPTIYPKILARLGGETLGN